MDQKLHKAPTPDERQEVQRLSAEYTIPLKKAAYKRKHDSKRLEFTANTDETE